ncbi:hypothetical protein PMIN03_010568 [Paraphaeosphaeria minitans]
MADASNGSHPPTATELKLEANKATLAQMQESIASLQSKLPPIERSLEGLLMNQREILKHLPPGGTKAPASEPCQPPESRSVASLVVAATPKTHRSVLSSVKEEGPDEEDGGEESESYEPPDVLVDSEDSSTEGEYDVTSKCRGKAFAVAAGTASQDRPCNMDTAAQGTGNTINQACKEPVSNCNGCRMGGGKVLVDTLTEPRKRQRS